MSDDNFDFEDDSTDQQSNTGPKALRDAYGKEKQRAEAAEAELEKLRKERKDETLNSFIETKGLPAKARNLIEQSGLEPEKWFEEYGDMFGTTEQPPANTPQPNTPPQTSLTPEQTAQLQGAVDYQPGNFEPGAHDELESKLDELEASAKSPEDFYAGLRNMGATG